MYTSMPGSSVLLCHRVHCGGGRLAGWLASRNVSWQPECWNDKSSPLVLVILDAVCKPSEQKASGGLLGSVDLAFHMRLYPHALAAAGFSHAGSHCNQSSATPMLLFTIRCFLKISFLIFFNLINWVSSTYGTQFISMSSVFKNVLINKNATPF